MTDESQSSRIELPRLAAAAQAHGLRVLIRADADQEPLDALLEERFRAAVEQEKRRIRARKPWYQRLFPFTITIKRRV